jgi:hypothetical protein
MHTDHVPPNNPIYLEGLVVQVSLVGVMPPPVTPQKRVANLTLSPEQAEAQGLGLEDLVKVQVVEL